jgi:hypothetical protein
MCLDVSRIFQGFERELGYFSLHELTQGTDLMGLGIERDLNLTVSNPNTIWVRLRV